MKGSADKECPFGDTDDEGRPAICHRRIRCIDCITYQQKTFKESIRRRPTFTDPPPA
jgi:hypothetical protein